MLIKLEILTNKQLAKLYQECEDKRPIDVYTYAQLFCVEYTPGGVKVSFLINLNIDSISAPVKGYDFLTFETTL